MVVLPLMFLHSIFIIKQVTGTPGGSAMWHLPSAQGVIMETRDRDPRRAPCMDPASLSACVSHE